MRTRLAAAACYHLSRQLIRHYPAAAGLPFAFVDPSRQCLHVVRNLNVCAGYPVSTSRYGLGTRNHSLQTPYGAHCVVEKIGDGEPLYMRFSARKPTGEIVPARRFADERDDAICTRILRLAGLEPGLNKGGCRDSYRRCIYLHGTPCEGRIGQPSSIGCIRMRNTDVVRLFDTLCVGSLVYIFKLPA